MFRHVTVLGVDCLFPSKTEAQLTLMICTCVTYPRASVCISFPSQTVVSTALVTPRPSACLKEWQKECPCQIRNSPAILDVNKENSKRKLRKLRPFLTTLKLRDLSLRQCCQMRDVRTPAGSHQKTEDNLQILWAFFFPFKILISDVPTNLCQRPSVLVRCIIKSILL